ncbi:hypothetical protein SAMN05216490_0010 [Mucilaginibacter mallensis]|uniref:Uncharacterized protein n=1 Tax=Mucilaginibacter mallensis TaxID=652787 RepID=A0A1H1M7G6_MUCMA|nr:hypothetical protein [Mucilaginibacter mallensis]SDR82567.1 hypothetical protein SAMN05216490_0010 [Mucilaginibacter mallensis]
MKKTIIILFLLASALLVKAQHVQPDSIIKVTPTKTGTHTTYAYTIAGKVQTPDEVKIKLLAYVPSANEFQQAKIETKWAVVSTVGFAVSAIGAVIEYANNNNAPVTEHHSLTGAYIFTGVATAFFTSAVINLVQAGKHKTKAMKVYNQRFE